MNLIKHVIDPDRLLLVWQAPEEGRSRTRFVVGELRQHEGQVVFRYLPDTDEFKKACAEGFICYPAFRKTGQEYSQGVLDSFLRRLPPRKRGDFGKYLEQWRLAPNVEISDFALLGHTGAKLPNDGFALINPFDNIEPPFEFYIEVAGFRHQPNISIDDISVGMSAVFIAEHDNEYNHDAVRIEVAGKKIGYVSDAQCKAFNSWLGRYFINASVERINGTSERPLVYIYGRVERAQHCKAVA
ncbi:MAG: HIRAN domain-containing protein [Methylobacter tundripaludum]|nr:HIRAN domain-containing protein [Methylobacter tundripaludum]